MNFRKFSFRPGARFGSIYGNRFSDVKTSLKRCWGKVRAGDLSRPKWVGSKIKAEQVAASLNVALVLLVIGLAAYWVLRMAQVSFPPALAGKGVLFYQSDSDQSVRSLFGEKSFDASRLALRGVVITGNEGGANQGMALIEVDGKPAEAVSVGEMVPPGIRLEKISPDGVTVTYQGREISLQQSFDNASGKSQ